MKKTLFIFLLSLIANSCLWGFSLNGDRFWILFRNELDKNSEIILDRTKIGESRWGNIITTFIMTQQKSNTFHVYAFESRCDDDSSVDYYKEVIHWVEDESLLKEEVAAYINAYDMFYLEGTTHRVYMSAKINDIILRTPEKQYFLLKTSQNIRTIGDYFEDARKAEMLEDL